MSVIPSNRSEVPLYAAIRTNQIGVEISLLSETHAALPALRTWSRRLKGGCNSVLDATVDDDGADEYPYGQNNGVSAAYPSAHKRSANHQPKTRQHNRQSRYKKAEPLSFEWAWGSLDCHGTWSSEAAGQ
jgi:hypothetical protein